MVALYAQGLSRQAAAEKLCVSEETVKTHARGIYRKLDVHSQTEVATLVERTSVALHDMEVPHADKGFGVAE